MNIEMTDLDMILNHLETTSLEPHDDYTSEITYKDQKILYKYIKELQQENQQLKDKNTQLRIEISAREEEYKKLKNALKAKYYSKYYIQGSDHYLVPKDIFVELFNEMINWKQENEQLKAQLELFENGVYFSRENDRLEEENDKLKEQLEELREETIIDTLDLQTHEYQQQEFIKYLENEINIGVFSKCVYNTILQKYKEIIGGNKDDK